MPLPSPFMYSQFSHSPVHDLWNWKAFSIGPTMKQSVSPTWVWDRMSTNYQSPLPVPPTMSTSIHSYCSGSVACHGGKVGLSTSGFNSQPSCSPISTPNCIIIYVHSTNFYNWNRVVKNLEFLNSCKILGTKWENEWILVPFQEVIYYNAFFFGFVFHSTSCRYSKFVYMFHSLFIMDIP
jgi:hypothetical protein